LGVVVAVVAVVAAAVAAVPIVRRKVNKSKKVKISLVF
jgi:hypothetical protein